jgi:3-oxoacyl-(acyl-carrier-protein) synthase
MNPAGIDITGMGCICAPGTSVEAAMESVYSGMRYPAKPVNIETTLEQVYPAFEVLQELPIIDPALTRTSKFALQAANEALDQAGLDPDYLKSKKVGVCIGTTVGCTLNNEPFYRDYKKNIYPAIDAIDRYLTNNPAVFITRKFNLKGPVATIANACSSGTDAIGMAKSWIEKGYCDIAIAGGADELSRITYLGFISLLISSIEACRPFDKNRKGLNLGEGAGIIILEGAESVRERQAKSLASVCGFGTFADAYHPTAPHPEGIGLGRAIRQALEQANITVEKIGFVNAHGTSTPNNDEVEGQVITKIFGDNIPVVSTKGYTGHTLGAAGGIEAVFSIRALRDQKLPATPGFEEFDPGCTLAPTIENTAVKAEYGISNSLAFGGNNSALVFRRAD